MWTYVSSNTGELWKVWKKLLTKHAIRQDMDKAIIESINELHWIRKDKPGLLEEMQHLVQRLTECKLKQVGRIVKEFLVNQKKYVCFVQLQDDIFALAQSCNVFQMEGVYVADEDWENLCLVVPQLKTEAVRRTLMTTVDFLYKQAVKSRKMPESLRKQVLSWFDQAKIRHSTGQDTEEKAVEVQPSPCTFMHKSLECGKC